MVVVGAASRDVAAEDPRGWRLGGSATYCSLAAARLGLRVGCLLGVDSLAAEADELALLEAAGVSLQRAALERGPVFENLEAGGHRRQRWLSKSDLVPTEALPAEWGGAGGWLLVPVAGELGPDWASVARTSRRVARVGVGWQGLLREFDDDGWVKRVEPGPSPLLTASGLVVASVDDLPGDTVLEELRPLAPDAVIVLTGGESGGVALRAGHRVRYRAVASNHVVDATGAGDVFLAALMASWLLTDELATAAALRVAAAAASCAVEGAGLAGVPTEVEVDARLRSL